MRGRRWAVSLAALAGAGSLAGCAGTPARGADPPSPRLLPADSLVATTATHSRHGVHHKAKPTAPYPKAFGVGIRTIVFVDKSRPTLDYAYDPPKVISDERVIDTKIRYPTLAGGAGPIPNARPATSFGPFPVIVFAHGYAVTPHTYEPLLDAWVRAGFVVVAPVFPVDNYFAWAAEGGGSAPEEDIWNEPADVVFVVDGVAPLARERGSFLDGLIAPSRMAFAGQSDGGNVMGALEYGKRFAPVRARLAVHPSAVGLFSGAEFDDGVLYGDPPKAPPLMFVQSDDDYCNSTEDATRLYDAVSPGTSARYFLRLDGADHLGPYDGQQPWSSVVNRTTTDFFEMALHPRGRYANSGTIIKTGTWSGVSSVSTTPTIDLPPTGDDGICGTPSPSP